MIHVGESGRIHGSGASLVDFNRGGTPLVEIVTEPDLRGAAEAAEWARLLRETVRQLGVSDVNMEEGSLRVDANVSVRPAGSEQLGTKTELKNMNSFRFLQRGVEAELERQRELIGGGGDGDPGDPPLRPGERQPHLAALEGGAHDYRYFPEPDLVPLAPTEADAARGPRGAAGAAGGADRALRRRAGAGRGRRPRCSPPTRRPPPTSSDRRRRDRRRRAASVVANWVTGELAAALRQRRETADAADSKVDPSALADLVGAGRGEEDLPRQRQDRAGGPGRRGRRPGGDRRARGPRPDVRRRAASWSRSSPPRSTANPEAAEQIRAGNGKAIGAIVGAVMKETKGRADGGEVNRLIREQLGGSCPGAKSRAFSSTL